MGDKDFGSQNYINMKNIAQDLSRANYEKKRFISFARSLGLWYWSKFKRVRDIMGNLKLKL